jgi:Mrp family chromosome partitioning ATPase
MLVAPHVDGLFLVVRWESTPLAAVKAVVRKLARYDLRFAGVVLNATDLKRATPPELVSMYRAGLAYGRGSYVASVE